MEQSLSWEAINHKASQEILHQKVHYRVHNNLRRPCVTLRKKLDLGVVSPTPNPQFGGRLLCRSSATVYSKSGGRLLYPEPMDATCHGNRVPY